VLILGEEALEKKYGGDFVLDLDLQREESRRGFV
jgi:hypothetical protein